MTIVSRLAAPLLLAALAASPTFAQRSPYSADLSVGSVPKADAKQQAAMNALANAPTVTAQQVAMMPRKMVGGQQLVQSSGKWYSLVASGAGNFKLVASGAGN